MNLSRRCFLSAAAGAPLAFAARERPNIVILLADDLGSGDLGFRGAKDIRTPNLDRLAREGVRFSQSYSNGAVCSPTRTALLTGQYQQRHGIDGVIYVQERDRGLPDNALTLAEVLKKAGYATGLIGKWHLGYPKETFPTRQGFDTFKGLLSGNIDYFQHVDRKLIPDLWDGEEPITDARYMTKFIGDETLRFLDRNARSPFFLYVAFNAPHDPFQAPEDAPLANQKAFVEKRDRATYARMVEAVDTEVGRITDKLRALRIDKKTCVFFMSDNGGVREVASNAPFRGYKGTLWEGGIRTPMVASWPGEFPSGRTVEGLVVGMDLFATAVDITGASLCHPGTSWTGSRWRLLAAGKAASAANGSSSTTRLQSRVLSTR